MALILGAASAPVAAGFSIGNACRFNGVAGEHMTRTASATAPTLATKSTLSFWYKATPHTTTQTNVCYTHGAVSPYFQIQMPEGGGNVTGKLMIQSYGGANSNNLSTSQTVLDAGAWYHIVYSYDSTPATPSSSSMKVFINGTQITALGTEQYSTQSTASPMTAASQTWPIGKSYDPSTLYPVDGYIAEWMVVDGQALDATDFGEFNEDSPTIWQPIDISDITVGDQGFYLNFADSADMGKDVGGNGFDYTLTSMDATNQTTDTPTNNFCNMNSLDNYYAVTSFTHGNGKMVTNSTNQTYNTGTMGLSAGKWYFEANCTSAAASDNQRIGIAEGVPTTSTFLLGEALYSYGLLGGDGAINNNNSSSSYGVGYTTGDVIGVYIDLDNSKLYFAKDGVIMNSGTGISLGAVSVTDNGFYLPAVGDASGSSSVTWEVNFGNPVSALTSAVNDSNGYGNFEYSPNDSGSASFDGSAKNFLAICSKNLGSDGG